MSEANAEQQAWELDHAAELERVRSELAGELTAAERSLRLALASAKNLINLYDVEVAEGIGQYTPEVLHHMLVTLAGVRATTVNAGLAAA